MEILGDRKFVVVPGSKTHELPPLLVRMTPGVKRLDKVMDMANYLVEQEDMIPLPAVEAPEADRRRTEMDMERRKLDLALNLVEQYLGFVQQWHWGDSVLEWIRQCETTFGTRLELRNLLRADVWPHAGRPSFVVLLEDKAINTHGVSIEKAVGLRVTFREPPPLRCFSDHFLMYLNSRVANSAYEAWSAMSPSPVSSFPPERFAFEVLDTSLH